MVFESLCPCLWKAFEEKIKQKVRQLSVIEGMGFQLTSHHPCGLDVPGEIILNNRYLRAHGSIGLLPRGIDVLMLEKISDRPVLCPCRITHSHVLRDMVAMIFPSGVSPPAVLVAARVSARYLSNFFAISRIFLALMVVLQVAPKVSAAREHF